RFGGRRNVSADRLPRRPWRRRRIALIEQCLELVDPRLQPLLFANELTDQLVDRLEGRLGLVADKFSDVRAQLQLGAFVSTRALFALENGDARLDSHALFADVSL